MAIQYYPLSRIRTGLNTGGNQYTLNGSPYSGPYYLTYNGDAFTGQNPGTGPNELLAPIGQDTSGLYDKSIADEVRSRFAVKKRGIPTTVSTIKASTPTNDGVQLKILAPYYPIPVDSDYKQGHFTRYFAKKINQSGYIIEISLDDYVTITEDNQYEDYEVIDMFWQLTGPLNDKRVSQYQVVGGVATTNERITRAKAKSFNGLFEFIGGNYTKFARITE